MVMDLDSSWGGTWVFDRDTAHRQGNSDPSFCRCRSMPQPKARQHSATASGVPSEIKSSRAVVRACSVESRLSAIPVAGSSIDSAPCTAPGTVTPPRSPGEHSCGGILYRPTALLTPASALLLASVGPLKAGAEHQQPGRLPRRDVGWVVLVQQTSGSINQCLGSV